jgi:hypothetical protein
MIIGSNPFWRAIHTNTRLRQFFVSGVMGLGLIQPFATPSAHAARPLLAPLVADRAKSSSSVPLWVSARAAFRPDGELRAEMFATVPLSMLNDNRRQNSGSECRVVLGSPPLEDFTPKDSFDALVSSALTILEGQVISTDVGFLNGVPGTLVSLRVIETFKSLGHIATKGNIHVFVGEATIPTPTGVICSGTFSKVPTPAIGDDVVIFASVEPLDAEHRILSLDDRKQLVVHRLGHVYKPVLSSGAASWPSDCCSDLVDLGSRIRENKHLHDMPVRIRE